MPRRKKTRVQPESNQLRLNLCFRADDQMERMVYDMLQAPAMKKSRSHLVAQAVAGMLFVDKDGNLDSHSIENIITETVGKCTQGAIIVQPQYAEPSETQEPKENTSKDFQLAAAQEAALDSMLDHFL
jgi:hypothetical protein